MCILICFLELKCVCRVRFLGGDKNMCSFFFSVNYVNIKLITTETEHFISLARLFYVVVF